MLFLLISAWCKLGRYDFYIKFWWQDMLEFTHRREIKEKIRGEWDRAMMHIKVKPAGIRWNGALFFFLNLLPICQADWLWEEHPVWLVARKGRMWKDPLGKEKTSLHVSVLSHKRLCSILSVHTHSHFHLQLIVPPHPLLQSNVDLSHKPSP